MRNSIRYNCPRLCIRYVLLAISNHCAELPRESSAQEYSH